MHNTNLKTLKFVKRTFLAALTFPPILFSGCAQSGRTGNQSIPADNPAMYHYNPATRGFETRWPFGPANYH